MWWPAVPLLHTLLLSPVRNDALVCSLVSCPLPRLFCCPRYNCSAAPCPPLCSQPTQPCRATEMDAAAAGPPLSFEQAQADWQALLARMKAQRQAAQVSGRKSRPCLVGNSLCHGLLQPCVQACPGWAWFSPLTAPCNTPLRPCSLHRSRARWACPPAGRAGVAQSSVRRHACRRCWCVCLKAEARSDLCTGRRMPCHLLCPPLKRRPDRCCCAC